MGFIAPFVTRLILADAQTLDAVGQLGMANRFTLPLMVFASAFQTAFMPIYFSLRKDESAKNTDTLARTARFLWTGSIALAIAATFLIPPVMYLVTPDQFHNAPPLVPILVFGFLGQTVYYVFGSEIYYSKRTYLVPIVSAASAIVTIGVSFATVKTMGAAGIAWANSLGNWAMALAALFFARRLVAIPHCRRDLTRLIACAVAVSVVAWFAAEGPLLQQFIVGFAAVVALPVLLWLTGDPTVPQAVEFVRRRILKWHR
jgi:O-antigen/teichoic acid export membrane protein